MSTGLQKTLAESLLASHPQDAARALEAVPAGPAAALLERAPGSSGSSVLEAMVPHAATAVLQEMAPDVAARLLAHVPIHAAARLLRRLDAERRDSLLSLLPPRPQRALRALASYPEQTAGALMDPEVLALPDDITAREARSRVRSAPEHARYNVYVVDREGRLVGALNLRELFLAAPSATLASVMTRLVHRLAASADRHAIVQHPGWREGHALPVVDPNGRYLGALRYRTLRRLEEELRGVADARDVTVDALGELFATGASGVLKALTSEGDGAGRAPR